MKHFHVRWDNQIFILINSLLITILNICNVLNTQWAGCDWRKTFSKKILSLTTIVLGLRTARAEKSSRSNSSAPPKFRRRERLLGPAGGLLNSATVFPFRSFPPPAASTRSLDGASSISLLQPLKFCRAWRALPRAVSISEPRFQRHGVKGFFGRTRGVSDRISISEALGQSRESSKIMC
jgi:hypothetical protein